MARTYRSPRGLVAKPVLKNTGLATVRSPLHRKPGQSGAALLHGGLPAPDSALLMDYLKAFRRDGFDGRFPLQFGVASGRGLFQRLSSIEL